MLVGNVHQGPLLLAMQYVSVLAPIMGLLMHDRCVLYVDLALFRTLTAASFALIGRFVLFNRLHSSTFI